jgi:hypothetical protein
VRHQAARGNPATHVDVILAFNRGAYRARAVVVKKRFSSEGQLSMRQERMLGVAMLVAGLVIAGVAVTRMQPDSVVHAQATPPATSQQNDQPAQSMPGGTRPTTPAPEPARPQNNEGSTTGTSPPGTSQPGTADRPPVTGTPLPPAPAEKTGEPLQRK